MIEIYSHKEKRICLDPAGVLIITIFVNIYNFYISATTLSPRMEGVHCSDVTEISCHHLAPGRMPLYPDTLI